MAQTCSKCHEEKLDTAFYKDSSKASGLATTCSECTKEKVKAWYQKNKHRVSRQRTGSYNRDRHYKRKYGISLEQYEALDVDGICQNPGCDQRAEDQRYDRLVVDHDHETQLVRGLLCQGCNKALGLLGDDMKRITGLLEYLGENI